MISQGNEHLSEMEQLETKVTDEAKLIATYWHELRKQGLPLNLCIHLVTLFASMRLASLGLKGKR